MKKITRVLSGALAVAMLGTTLVGCGKKEEVVIDQKIVSLPPEEQILTDTYRQNPVINEYMTYTENIVTLVKFPGTASEKTETAFWKMFNPNIIQLDCMDLIVVGESTMGDIVNTVDQANKDAINHAIESVRSARQEILDKEYAEAKAKAAAKGKQYDEPRPEADVSDLYYENPYTYFLAYPNPDTKTAVQYPYLWDTYQGKKLVDPSVDPIMYLFIYKYDVPYVQCTFESIGAKITGTQGSYSYGGGQTTTNNGARVKLYNNYIDQEQDWVLTAIAPADCTFLVDQELVVTPEYVLPSYVDEDWRSKGSKNNMVTNGNIKFGGEGFTWDSLMTLCHQLDLVMLEEWYATTQVDASITAKQASTYSQHSDSQFTYYTIRIPINHMFKQKDGALACPIANILVTFNKLSNDCVNWEINYGAAYHIFPPDATHTPGQQISVDVRNYQLDTTDYAGMLTTVDNWVKQNQENADFGYFFVDKNGAVVGKIEEGLKNYKTELTVNGELYYFVGNAGDNAMTGYYISQTEKEKIDSNAENAQETLDKTKKQYYIICMAVATNSKGQLVPLGYFNDTGALVDERKELSGYYIHSVTYDNQVGYKDAVIIGQSAFSSLLEMYVRTFKIEGSVQEKLISIYNENDPWKMRQYMQSYVEVNLEERERIEQQVGSTVDNLLNPPVVVTDGKLNILDATS